MAKFTRRIEIYPAWDRRTEGLGCHSMEIHYILIGRHGALRLEADTGMYPDGDVPHGTFQRGILSYHSKRPLREYHEQSRSELIGWGYWDITYHARDIAELTLSGGSDAVFAALEDHYKETWGQSGWLARCKKRLAFLFGRRYE